MRAVRVAVRLRAALLLEVVVALAVLVAAMGLLSTQLVNGLDMTVFAEEQLRASQLADRILALVELDPNMLQQVSELAEEEPLEDEFGGAYPGYFWRVWTQPVDPDTPELQLVTIEVLYQRDEEEFDNIEGAEVLRRLALLRAEPARIDLVEDGGFSEEAAEALRQQIPIAEFDPRAVDLHQLVALDTQALLELLPMLMELFSHAGGLSSDLLDQLGQGGGLDELEGLDELPAEFPGGLGELLDAGGVPGRGGRGRREAGASGGEGGGRGRGGGRGPEAGRGSGEEGRYTIEDLMRMRDEYRRQPGGR